MEVIKDQTGKKSSRRIAGLVCIGVGLVISLSVAVLNAFGKQFDPQVIDTVIFYPYIIGGILLGAGVAEVFSKRLNFDNKKIKKGVG